MFLRATMPRYAVRIGTQLIAGRGFRFMTEASRWIDAHRNSGAMDWRVGTLFRLRGLNRDIEVIPADGKDRGYK